MEKQETQAAYAVMRAALNERQCRVYLAVEAPLHCARVRRPAGSVPVRRQGVHRVLECRIERAILDVLRAVEWHLLGDRLH